MCYNYNHVIIIDRRNERKKTTLSNNGQENSVLSNDRQAGAQSFGSSKKGSYIMDYVIYLITVHIVTESRCMLCYSNNNYIIIVYDNLVTTMRPHDIIITS